MAELRSPHLGSAARGMRGCLWLLLALAPEALGATLRDPPRRKHIQHSREVPKKDWKSTNQILDDTFEQIDAQKEKARKQAKAAADSVVEGLEDDLDDGLIDELEEEAGVAGAKHVKRERKKAKRASKEHKQVDPELAPEATDEVEVEGDQVEVEGDRSGPSERHPRVLQDLPHEAVQTRSVARARAWAAGVPTKTIVPGVEMPKVMLGMGGRLMRQTGQPGPMGEMGRGRAKTMAMLWLDAGGRGLDTAQVYNTEAAAGGAVKARLVPRGEVFILSKLTPIQPPYQSPFFAKVTQLSPDQESIQTKVRASVNATLERLRTSFLDLMLVDGPASDLEAQWQALEQLHAEGKIRALGVSNFGVKELEKLREVAVAPIAVNQRKMNLRHDDNEVLSYCRRNGIQYQASSPLGEASRAVLEDPVVKLIAGFHKKTAAQVALRWLIQKGAAVTVQTENGDHMRQDMDVFSWNLEDEDMKQLDMLPDEK